MTVKHLQNIQSSKLMGECLLRAGGSRQFFRQKHLAELSRAAAQARLSPLDGEMELGTG